jgi:hypothetical protein
MTMGSPFVMPPWSSHTRGERFGGRKGVGACLNSAAVVGDCSQHDGPPGHGADYRSLLGDTVSSTRAGEATHSGSPDEAVVVCAAAKARSLETASDLEALSSARARGVVTNMCA